MDLLALSQRMARSASVERAGPLGSMWGRHDLRFRLYPHSSHGEYTHGNDGGTTPTATTAASNGQAVTITTDSSGSFAFDPTTLTIKVGTKVTWTNMTQAGHTVTSDDGKSFDSGISHPIAASGGTYSFTFTKAGTFPYHCQIHPFMKATITVTS